jgi:SH3-like domain-containing protein
MKKMISIASIFFISFSVLFLVTSCKKDEKKSENINIKKYAKFRAAVFKDKNLKEWLATLEKTESAEIITSEKIESGNRTIEIASIRLSDGKQGFINQEFLAEKPVVFIDENVKAYQRPDAGSAVVVTVPKGTIGFIIDEKADWVKIYIGNVSGIWITGHWVKGGFSVDEVLVQSAKDYETALNLLSNNKESSKKEAKDKLTELSSGSSVISELSKKKLEELLGVDSPDIPAGEQQQKEKRDEQSPGIRKN